MNCVMFGADGGSSNANTEYNFLNPSGASAWSTTESTRQIPMSEDITVTELRIYLAASPGAGNSYTYTIRDDGSGTAASVTISDAATSGTWTGSVSISQGSLVCLESVPNSGPTSAKVGIQIWYSTTGQKCLLMAGTTNTASNSATNNTSPCGADQNGWSTSATNNEIQIPTAGNFTRLYAATPAGAPGAGTSYAVSGRLNNTSNFLTATIADANISATTTGTQAVSAGDRLILRSVPSGTPTARQVGVCLTFEPTVNGECIYGFGNSDSPSNSATEFNEMLNTGLAAWNATESLAANYPPAVDFKKLYVRVGTAPGVGNSRTIALRDNGSTTALSVTISDANTTGNNTGDTVSVSGGGNVGNFQASIAGTPATATGGVHIGYVMAVTQPAGTTIKDIISNTGFWAAPR